MTHPVETHGRAVEATSDFIAVGMAERDAGGWGAAGNYAMSAWEGAGYLVGSAVGAKGIGEAIWGVDITTAAELSTEERWVRGAAGVSALAFTAAGRVGGYRPQFNAQWGLRSFRPGGPGWQLVTNSVNYGGYRMGLSQHARFPSGVQDDFLNAAGRIPNEAGYFDLYVHSRNAGTSFGKSVLESADLLDVEKALLATGWKPGQPIRVISCRVGDPALGSRAAAKQLSDLLEVKIKAPTEDIIIYKDGTYAITNGPDLGPGRTRSTGTWTTYRE